MFALWLTLLALAILSIAKASPSAIGNAAASSLALQPKATGKSTTDQSNFFNSTPGDSSIEQSPSTLVTSHYKAPSKRDASPADCLGANPNAANVLLCALKSMESAGVVTPAKAEAGGPTTRQATEAKSTTQQANIRVKTETVDITLQPSTISKTVIITATKPTKPKSTVTVTTWI